MLPRASSRLCLVLFLLAGGCSTAVMTSVPPPSGPAPDGCGRDFPAKAPVLELDPTVAPAAAPRRKGVPYSFASSLPVNRELATTGLWTDFEDGWSSLALRLRSEGARTLSVHLTQASLPPMTEIWLCSGDGRVRQGPYREAVGGELWTPVVPGSEARIEVILPTQHKRSFEGLLAEAFGGYR